MKCLYAARGRLVSKSFVRPLMWHESALRRLIEWGLDKKEMWAMRHDFKRMEDMARELEETAAFIERIRAEFGLDEKERP